MPSQELQACQQVDPYRVTLTVASWILRLTLSPGLARLLSRIRVPVHEPPRYGSPPSRAANRLGPPDFRFTSLLARLLSSGHPALTPDPLYFARTVRI